LFHAPCNKEHFCVKDAYLWDDELPSEQTDGRQNTIYEKWDRRKGVDGGVNVSKSLQELQASTIAIP
jgi:hypothetical protein